MKHCKNFLPLLFLLVLFQASPVLAQEFPAPSESFEFVFMTDIHLRPDMDAPAGFRMAIDEVNLINPDFVLTGGDLVFDVMRGNQQKGDSLFTLYKEMSSSFNMPVYNCLGNHDLFAIYPESPEDENHPDYKYGMFERHLGKSYYSFGHKGWHFIVLNSLDVTEDGKYKGFINETQMEWLKQDIEKVDKATPVVLVTHIPLITVWQFVNGGDGTRSVENSASVFNILQEHNLKLVLQGHIHWMESGEVNNRFTYITGGSIAGNGWKGRRHNTREGFLLLRVNQGEVSWEYVDHGWERERMSRESN